MSEWSSLGDEARAQTRQPGPRCQVETFLAELDDDAAEIVKRNLADSSVSTMGLRRALLLLDGESGLPLWSLQNHRRGNCRCNRKEV